MKINQKHTLTNRLIAYILLVSLFLQSCSKSLNAPVPGEKESPDNIQESTRRVHINPLIGHELAASGGHFVAFHEQDGNLQADVRVDPNQKAIYKGLTVVIEKGIEIMALLHLNSKIQRRRIHIQPPSNGQPGRVLIFKGGLLGGMMEGEGDQEKNREKEKEKEVKPDNDSSNYQRLLEFAIQGDSEAQFQIGQKAYNAWQEQPTEEEAHEARGWLEKAAEQNHQGAISLLDKIEEALDEEVKKHKATYKRLSFNTFLPLISEQEIQYGDTLGFGGMGIVYQATYQGEVVAVKKLHPQHVSNKQVLATFRNEAMIMANHHHNNLVTFLGFCLSQNALVMEYVPGGSLWNLLNNSKDKNWDNSWQLRYQIALDVCEGMSYLHDQGIVHRDLKSENILLNSSGRAIVTDFGISALKSENSTFGKWEEEGTYRWMAPEIFHTYKNSKAGDVYSYGMVLWQLGARKEPFATVKGLVQLYEHIKAGHHEKISDDTPLQIRKVIEACWLPEPPFKKETDIYQRPSMKQVRHLLEEGHLNFKAYHHPNFSVEKEEREKEKEELMNRLEKLNKEKNTVEKKRKKLTSGLEKLGKEKEELLSKLERSDKQNEDLTNELGILNKQKRELANRLEELEKIKDPIEEKKNDLKGPAEDLVIEKEKEKKGREPKNQLKKILDYLKINWSTNYINFYLFYIFLIGGILCGLIYIVFFVPLPSPVNSKCYQLATQQINSYQSNSSNIYYNGCEVTKDYTRVTNQDYRQNIKSYQEAVKQGNKDAQYNLAEVYYYGHGVEQDYKKAFEWYQQAADQGHRDAQCNMGFMYNNGLGTQQNYQKALIWYQKAAEKDHPTAQYNLGLMYENGWGLDQDYIKAKEWYEKAAKQGHIDAQNNLGNMYYNGQGADKDYKKAVEWYQEAVKKDHIIAQYNLGNMHYDGQGIKQSYEKARNYYEQSADKGNTAAQNNLGFMYQHGCGVTQSYQKALEYYQKAANQGNAYAQNNLGNMFKNGWEVKKDYQEALKWYQQAADQGHEDAEEQVILLTNVNTNRLLKIVSQAEKEDMAAQSYLGDIYYNGWGVEKDYQKALKWYEKVAEKGNTIAQNNLGDMYKNGWGTKQDYIKAKEWYEKAAKSGNMDAEDALKHINGQTNIDATYQQDVSVATRIDNESHNNSIQPANQQAENKDKGGVSSVATEEKTNDEKDNSLNYKSIALIGVGVSLCSLLVYYILKWNRKAVEPGNATVQSTIDKGLKKKISQGGGTAQYKYKMGKRAKKKNYQEALKWFREAAEQGNTSAQNSLGDIHYYGKGEVAQSYEQAVKWYKKAALQGNAKAQYSLGYMYQYGQGKTKNDKKAIKWYLKAANQGNADAQNKLGYIEQHSQGIDPNYQKAVKWYEKAALQGNATAQYNLGLMYYNGYGVSKNQQEAIKWFQKAAAQGDPDAQAKVRELA